VAERRGYSTEATLASLAWQRSSGLQPSLKVLTTGGKMVKMKMKLKRLTRK